MEQTLESAMEKKQTSSNRSNHTSSGKVSESKDVRKLANLNSGAVRKQSEVEGPSSWKKNNNAASRNNLRDGPGVFRRNKDREAQQVSAISGSGESYIQDFNYQQDFGVAQNGGVKQKYKGFDKKNRRENKPRQPKNCRDNIKKTKERQLQARCSFLVNPWIEARVRASTCLPVGCVLPPEEETAEIKDADDPDVLVSWTSVEEVELNMSQLVDCPICLYPPTAPQVTSCGHVYCYPCVLHYLALSDDKWRKCPICDELVKRGDLRSVVCVEQAYHAVGSTLSMCLMSCGGGGPPHPVGEGGMPPAKQRLRKADVRNVEEIISRELLALNAKMQEDKHAPECCFIEQAINLVNDRKNVLQSKYPRPQEIWQSFETETEDLKRPKSAFKIFSPVDDPSYDYFEMKDMEHEIGDVALKQNCFLDNSVEEDKSVIALQQNCFLDNSILLKQEDTSVKSKKVSRRSRRKKSYVIDCLYEPAPAKQPETEGNMTQAVNYPEKSPKSSWEDSTTSDISRQLETSNDQSMENGSDKSMENGTDANGNNSTSVGSGSIIDDSPDSEVLPICLADAVDSVSQKKSSEENGVEANCNGLVSIGSDLTIDENCINEVPPVISNAADSNANNRKQKLYDVKATRNYFYQASDGSHLYLLPLNMSMLETEYGRTDTLPPVIRATILQKESSLVERHEKDRFPFLRSLPVCCPYDVAELELGALVGEETQKQYAKKLEERRNKRLLSNKQENEIDLRIAAEQEKVQKGLFFYTRTASATSYVAPSQDQAGGFSFASAATRALVPQQTSWPTPGKGAKASEISGSKPPSAKKKKKEGPWGAPVYPGGPLKSPPKPAKLKEVPDEGGSPSQEVLDYNKKFEQDFTFSLRKGPSSQRKGKKGKK